MNMQSGLPGLLAGGATRSTRVTGTPQPAGVAGKAEVESGAGGQQAFHKILNNRRGSSDSKQDARSSRLSKVPETIAETSRQKTSRQKQHEHKTEADAHEPLLVFAPDSSLAGRQVVNTEQVKTLASTRLTRFVGSASLSAGQGPLKTGTEESAGVGPKTNESAAKKVALAGISRNGLTRSARVHRGVLKAFDAKPGGSDGKATNRRMQTERVVAEQASRDGTTAVFAADGADGEALLTIKPRKSLPASSESRKSDKTAALNGTGTANEKKFLLSTVKSPIRRVGVRFSSQRMRSSLPTSEKSLRRVGGETTVEGSTGHSANPSAMPSMMTPPPTSAKVIWPGVVHLANQAESVQSHNQSLTQLTQLVQSQQHLGVQSLQVKLHPAGLGELSILVMKAEDGVQVQIAANQSATLQWLNNNLADLSRTMQQNGVALSGLEVSWLGANAQGGDGHGRRESHHRTNDSNWSKVTSVESLDSMVQGPSAMARSEGPSRQINVRV
ncbi:MAG: flagellar hook-length control protein FliK [Alicyclobacillaceae bacterium]|nr:flagellar hook-length control protein FliK [Alicyclobacillaceae bacterium]